MKQTTTIGLDLAKQILQVHAADAEGAPVFSRKLRRADVLGFFKKTPRCLVGLEACGGAHYQAREIGALGHEVQLIPPAYVKPYLKRGKTDAADAEAICEAVTRKTMRFVPVKSADQQVAAMVLNTRELLVCQQTQAINALRAHLAELGIIAAAGTAKVASLIEIVEDRYDAGSVLITSQVPVDRWYEMIGTPTLANAVLDRLIHNAYRIELSGDSLWKHRPAGQPA